MPHSMDQINKQIPAAPTNTSVAMSRENIIAAGLSQLNDLGSHHICRVCISNSGSCCRDCSHLLDGMGCQSRNTSCTAWLCGFHKYFMYEIDLLEGWSAFWEQIPGQDYREDYTPERVYVRHTLPHVNQRIGKLGEALAADLQEMEQEHIAIGFILTLREKLDKYMDQLLHSGLDHKRKIRLQRKITLLTIDFQRFHRELENYRQTPAK